MECVIFIGKSGRKRTPGSNIQVNIRIWDPLLFHLDEKVEISPRRNLGSPRENSNFRLSEN